MSSWFDLGMMGLNFVVDYFSGDSDQPTGGGGSSAQMQKQSPQQTAYQQASLAQSKIDTGLSAGQQLSPFRAQNEMAKIVESNIEPDEIRTEIVAHLIRRGADPITVKNIQAQWDTQDRALAEPRKGLPQEGFAQTRTT